MCASEHMNRKIFNLNIFDFGQWTGEGKDREHALSLNRSNAFFKPASRTVFRCYNTKLLRIFFLRNEIMQTISSTLSCLAQIHLIAIASNAAFFFYLRKFGFSLRWKLRQRFANIIFSASLLLPRSSFLPEKVNSLRRIFDFRFYWMLVTPVIFGYRL